MSLRDNFEVGLLRWRGLNLYQRFENVVVLIITALIAVVVAAVWSLLLKIVVSLRSNRPCRYSRPYLA